MKRLADKVAFVTGAAGGMGTAIVRHFMAEGAKVVGADLKPTSDASLSLSLDVTTERSWSEAIAATLGQFGRLDILVNNAGIVLKLPTELVDTTVEDFQKIQTVNVNGVFLGTKHAINAMTPNRRGSIINIGSIANFIATPKSGAYAISKAAVTNLSKQAALEVAQRQLNIRVNTIHPGFVWTGLVSEKMSKIFGSEAEARTALASQNPFGKLVEPDDIAMAALFLASEESKMITGADIVVDGGRLLL